MLRKRIFKIKEGGTRSFYIRLTALVGFPFRSRIRGYRLCLEAMSSSIDAQRRKSESPFDSENSKQECI